MINKETMKWHCVDCHADFQGPKDRTPANGCEQCGSKRIFNCNVEFVGEVVKDEHGFLIVGHA